MKQLLLSSFLLLALGVPASHAQTYTSHDTSSILRSWADDGLSESVTCDRKVPSTTQPILTYSNGRRLVHVSGVLFSSFSADGSKVPSPDTTVNVIADVGHGFVAFQQVTTDSRGVYNVWFEAPAPIVSVSADSSSFVCINDKKTSAAQNAPEGYNVMAGDQ